jgi:hypothetical protein
VWRGAGLARRTLDEGGDALLVVERARLLDEVDLVLEDDDVLELHDLDDILMATMLNGAAVMDAAPLSIVAMRMSCPGQSTNETWRTRRMRELHPGRSHGGVSSFEDGYER